MMDSHATEEEEQPLDLRKWHVVRGVPIPTLLLLAAQTGALIWYAAQFTFEQRQQAARLTAVEIQLAKMVDGVNAGAGPAAVAAARLTVLESQVNQLQARQEAMRDQLNRPPR